MKLKLGKKMSMTLVALCLPLLGMAQEQQQASVSNTPIELTLDLALEIALNENPTVKVADLEIEKKKHEKKSTQSSLYPQIDAVGQYSRSVKKQVMSMEMGGQKMDIEVGKDNTWTAGGNLNWPIIVPTLWKSIQLSSLDVELAVESARSSKINMINSVSKAYYQALLAQDAYNVLEKSYDNAVLNHENINQKYKQGIVSEYDLIQADVNAKNIKPELIQAKNALELAALSLKAFMGIDMDQAIIVSGSLLDYEQELYAQLLKVNPSLENNSDLKQFDLQTKQLKKSLEIYKMQYMPTLAITGNYMYTSMYDDKESPKPDFTSSTVGVSLSIPIFDGFRKHNDIKKTKVNLQQMEWQREDIERNLELVVTSNMNNMVNYAEQVESTRDVVAQAQKGYEISQKLYDTGMVTLLEVNSAQLGLTQASLAYNQAIYNFLASKADLDKTLGIEPAIIVENNKK